jgi:ferric-dicitrate binding protein FerR (iron transport regulator)
MNDQSAGWSPDSGDDDEDGEGYRLRSTLERTLMDRARRAAERDRERGPRRWLQHSLALAAALALVLVIALGFDAFLTSMQKVMRILDENEAKSQQAQPQPDPAEPIPAYVVPAEPAPTGDTSESR